MPSITLKDFPSALHRELKMRAKTNRRSLSKEVIVTLEAATRVPPGTARSIIEESRETRSAFTRSVRASEIDLWKKHGRL